MQEEYIWIWPTEPIRPYSHTHKRRVPLFILLTFAHPNSLSMCLMPHMPGRMQESILMQVQILLQKFHSFVNELDNLPSLIVRDTRISPYHWVIVIGACMSTLTSVMGHDNNVLKN